jgi:hypothetical protein
VAQVPLAGASTWKWPARQSISAPQLIGSTYSEGDNADHIHTPFTTDYELVPAIAAKPPASGD